MYKKSVWISKMICNCSPMHMTNFNFVKYDFQISQNSMWPYAKDDECVC